MSLPIDDDCTAPDVEFGEWRKARKPHKCCACHEQIPPGHRYFYDGQLYDGNWQTWKRCARCQFLYSELWPLMGEDDAVDPWLDCGHTYEQNFGEPPPPELARLAFLTPDEAQELAR